MKASYFQILFLFPLIIISCDKSKRNNTDFEITIEKKGLIQLILKQK